MSLFASVVVLLEDYAISVDLHLNSPSSPRGIINWISSFCYLSMCFEISNNGDIHMPHWQLCPIHPSIFRTGLLFSKDIISQKKSPPRTNNAPQYPEEQGVNIWLWKCGRQNVPRTYGFAKPRHFDIFLPISVLWSEVIFSEGGINGEK